MAVTVYLLNAIKTPENAFINIAVNYQFMHRSVQA